MDDLNAFWARFQATCRALPGAEEYLMHGHPSFRTGKKCFVIMGDDSLSLKVNVLDQPFYLEDPRISRTHYIGQHGWITLDLAHAFRWEEVERVLHISYRLAASKKLLKEFEALHA